VSVAAPSRRRAASRPGRRLLRFDRALEARRVAGADEAGRGCLAGPLVCAAVLLDHERLRGRACAPLGMLDDSKRRTPALREQLFDAVLACAERVAVVVVPAATIDRRGLHRSNLAGLARALEQLDAPPGSALLADGFRLPLARPHRAVVDGDATSAAIAAASIVAKVTRDRLMRREHEQLPALRLRRARRLRNAAPPRRGARPRPLEAAPAELRLGRLPPAAAARGRGVRGRAARAARWMTRASARASGEGAPASARPRWRCAFAACACSRATCACAAAPRSTCSAAAERCSCSSR
jgi:ribonuclease HII